MGFSHAPLLVRRAETERRAVRVALASCQCCLATLARRQCHPVRTRFSMSTQDEWSPSSWKHKPITQAVTYPDQAAADRVLAAVSKLPPLVTSWEVETLKSGVGRSRPRTAIPPPRRRLLREFRRLPAGPDHQQAEDLLKMSIILIYGARAAGDSSGPLCGTIRQAAVGGDRNPRRRLPAELSGRFDQPPRVQRRGPDAQPRTRSSAATSGRR